MHPNARSISTFNTPIHAVLNGQPVRILACADLEGKSLGFVYADKTGKPGWESIEKFNLLDSNYMTQSEETLRAALQGAAQGAADASRSTAGRS